jgi:hypothetical protein
MSVRVESTEVVDCVAAVGDTFADVFSHIDEWRSHVERLTELNVRVTSSALDELVEALVVPELEQEDALIIGAGFVAAPGFLTDAHWHLAWWLGHSNTFGLGSAEPSIRRLTATEDPESENFRDYTALEWWRAPARTRSPHITGPYVDYLCTDDYTLTLTVPVAYENAMIGVAGADIYVNDIERLLLPFVRAIDASATIVNASGRVVVSTDPHRPTGSVLRVDDLRDHIATAASGSIELPDGRRLVACGTTSLALILG